MRLLPFSRKWYLKSDYKARRKLVSTLVREGYLPRPQAMAGDIVLALAEAGYFRLRGVLVGTVAFQCYSALLGIRLSNTMLQTADTDFAQFHSIAATVGDSMPDVLGVLQAIDPTFRAVPHLVDGRQSTQFVSRSGYKVEFLTDKRGSSEYASRPTWMPALGTASAQALRFLDFLIHEPVRAVLLHGAGVPVLVPAPERYAVHKLIVGSRRRTDADGTAKSRKDRMQARALMEAMIETRQREALAKAFIEAWDRGPAWRAAIGESLNTFDEGALGNVKEGLAAGMQRLEADPAKYEVK